MELKKNFKTKKSAKFFFEKFSNFLRRGHIIYLNGDLGVGKTYYSKIIINTLTGIRIIPSPTFNIINIYNLSNKVEIWHCDLYRIKNSEEINELGIFENYKNKIILIEWPDLIKNHIFEVINFNIFFGKKTYDRIVNISIPKKFNNFFL